MNPLRGLPSVDALLRSPQGAALVAAHGHGPAVAALRAQLDAARAAGLPREPEALLTDAAATLARPPSLRPLLNATGVIVHTNLGRSPLAEPALERVRAVAGGYSTLEFALDTGRRGSRHDHLSGLLAALTGAEAGIAVNNNAAAILLCLAAMAGEGRC